MIWSGLGINYNSTVANDSIDLPYLYSLGFRKVRMNIVSFSSDTTIWRAKCLFAKSLGFYVIFGISANPTTLTSTSWPTYSQKVQDEATYCQANNICDEFVVGNELESQNDDTTLTDTDVRNNCRTLATTVQGIFTRGPVSTTINSQKVGTWVSEGKGDFDYLSLNVYASGNDTVFTSAISQMYSAFGTNGTYISEWGIHENWSSVTTDQEQQAIRVAKRQKIIKDSGITSAYFYNWMTSTDDFGVKLLSGDFRLMWNPLATNNGRRFFVNV